MPRSTLLPPAAAAVQLFMPETPVPLDFTAIFKRHAPLEVDLGCGDGSVVAALAAQNPGRDYLGVEQLRGRISSACRKIAHRRLPNARILRGEIALVVRDFLPPASVSTFHLLFPDPWPKRRHHVRRIVHPVWLRAVAQALVPGGTLRLVTDDVPYFTWMERALAAVPELQAEPTPSDEEFPLSTFEKEFRGLGTPIHRLTARQVLPMNSLQNPARAQPL